MILRNLTRDDGDLHNFDIVEIINAEDAQQNGTYTLCSIESDDGELFELTLVSQSQPGFVTVVTVEGLPIGGPNTNNSTLQ